MATKRKKKTTPAPPGFTDLVSSVEILAIRAEELLAVRLVPDDALPTNLALRGSERAEGESDPDRQELIVRARFSFWASAIEDNEKDEREDVARATATFVLRYRVPRTILEDLSPEIIAEFASRNGVYNAWPYWREYLQNTMMRLGIPGIVAPVYRLPRSRKPLASKRTTATRTPSGPQGPNKDTPKRARTSTRKKAGKASSKKRRA